MLSKKYFHNIAIKQKKKYRPSCAS